MQQRRGSLVDPLDVVERDRRCAFRGNLPQQIDHGIEQSAAIARIGRRAGFGKQHAEIRREVLRAVARGQSLAECRTRSRRGGPLRARSPARSRRRRRRTIMRSAMRPRRWLLPIPASPVTRSTSDARRFDGRRHDASGSAHARHRGRHDKGAGGRPSGLRRIVWRRARTGRQDARVAATVCSVLAGLLQFV